MPQSDLKNVTWSNESEFLLGHADRARIWHKQHECMDLSCPVPPVQAAAGVGLMFWGISSGHINFINCYNLLEYCSGPYTPFHGHSLAIFHSNNYLQQDNLSCHKIQAMSFQAGCA